MSHLYNEIEPAAVEWLENLMLTGKIPWGKIDARSIAELNGDRGGDLDGVVQFHTFAGIGGWALALRQAGWPEDLEAWSGSCPCQPFSAAGNLGKENDPRHQWPNFLKLIAARRAAGKPVPVIFGEQVASAPGRSWLADVRSDLGALGYETGGADLPAAGAGGKHLRQRLYWVADSRVQEHGWRDRLVSAARLAARSRGDLRGGAQSFGGWKPDEPRPSAVADGVPARVALIKGYGNAIFPPIAAEFIMSYMETYLDA